MLELCYIAYTLSLRFFSLMYELQSKFFTYLYFNIVLFVETKQKQLTILYSLTTYKVRNRKYKRRP
jgi:hypothetical protein